MEAHGRSPFGGSPANRPSPLGPGPRLQHRRSSKNAKLPSLHDDFTCIHISSPPHTPPPPHTPHTTHTIHAHTARVHVHGGRMGAVQTDDEMDMLEAAAKAKPHKMNYGSGGPPGKVKAKVVQEDDDPDADSDSDNDREETKKKKQLMTQFDDEYNGVKGMLEGDPNSTFKFDDVQLMQDGKFTFNPFKIIKRVVNDFLIPPQVQPYWERERAQIMAERAAEIAMKKKQEAEELAALERRLRGEDEETEEERRARLNEANGGLRDHPQVDFEKRFPDGVPPNWDRGPGAAILNIEYTRPSLVVYEGDRVGGARHGVGKQTFENGDTYEGDWLFNIPDGFGHYVSAKGEQYIGQWHLGKQLGLGVYRAKSGATYMGFWKEGTMHGYGEFHHKKKGTIFSGEWREGVRHGYGMKAWVRSGNAFVGRWVHGKKDGDGLLRSDTSKIGIGRFHTKWKEGKLLLRGPYDPLVHGTVVTEASAWASHYAKEGAIDADLVAKQKVPFPEVPLRPKRDKEITTMTEKEIPDWKKNFRATFDLVEKREKIYEDDEEKYQREEEEMQRVETDKKMFDDIDPDETHVIPARAFKRLISLVHSSDAIVEEIMVPILNDAQIITEGKDEAFKFSGIYRVQMEKLKHHYAVKIQRQWRRSTLTRSVKGTLKNAHKPLGETAEEKVARLRREYEAAHKEIRDAIIEVLENDPACEQLKRNPDDSEGLVQLKVQARKLFRLERMEAPTNETNEKILLSRNITRKLDEGKKVGLDDGEDEAGRRRPPRLRIMNRLATSSSLGGLTDYGSSPRSPGTVRSPGNVSPLQRGFSSRKVDPGLFPMLEVSRQKQHGLRDPAEDLRVDTPASRITRASTTDGAGSDSDDDGFLDALLVFGLRKLNDGTHYSGQLLRGVPHGYGKVLYPNGATYSGEFEKGSRSGHGVYTTAKNKQGEFSEAVRIYYGEWDRGMRDGFGLEQIIKDRDTVSTCAVEHREDFRVAISFVQPGAHAEWIEAIQAHSMAGERASYQAMIEQPPEALISLAMSDHVEFSLGEGIMKYSGGFDRIGNKSGMGIQMWDDGMLYAGMWQEGLPHGMGRERYPDGCTYLGEFSKGQRHGIGMYQRVSSGLSFIGEWRRGMRDGRGVETKEKGGKIEWRALMDYAKDDLEVVENYHPRKAGAWLESAEMKVRAAAKIAGKTYPAAHIDYEPGNAKGLKSYVGGQYEGIKIGAGILEMEDGRKYIGEFLDDEMDGYGVETYPDGSTYTGEFRKNRRHGYGEYKHSSGRIYIGEWMYGKRHGKGWERIRVSMASGLVVREYLVEFEHEVELTRKLLTNKRMPFILRAQEMIKRGEEAHLATVEHYKEMLD